jgi:hypothetical protein
LQPLFSIDTGNESVINTGLTDIESFCVDKDGGLFIMMRQSPDHFIYRFDSSGRFLASFGRKGQGPGEFDWGGTILFVDRGLLLAKDMSVEKCFIFTRNGELIDTIYNDKNIDPVQPLENGELLVRWREPDPERPVYRESIGLSRDMRNRREVYRTETDDPLRAPRYRPRSGMIQATASNRHIFIGDPREGYLIRVFDLSGKLLRKISKAAKLIPFPDEEKSMIKKVLGRTERGRELLSRTDFPAHRPPFRYLFADEQDRLFVMTGEPGKGRSYRYDIFSREGEFIGNLFLDNIHVVYSQGEKYYDEPLQVIAEDNRLFCLREKCDGYKTIDVFQMIW